MGESALKYDPLDPPDSPLQLDTDQKHVIEYYVRDLVRVEAEDRHFHPGSAVFLGESSDLTLPGAGDTVGGLDVLRVLYNHAKAHKDHKLLITGHADPGEPGGDALKLSRQRAKGLHALVTGDRDTWVDIAVKHGLVEDYQQLLIWFNALMGWPCRPGEKNGKHDAATSSALQGFQACYNQDFEKEIAVDGDMGRESWGAMFDVMLAELAASLDTDADGLKSAQQSLTFLDPPFLACGDKLPCERLGGDYRGGNRRVELLFCAPDEVPPKPALKDGDKCKLFPPAIRYNALEVKPNPRRLWFTFQAVDELGYHLPNLKLQLVHKGQVVETITTTDGGTWTERIAVPLPIEVRTEKGEPVYFSTQEVGDKGRAAQLVPGIGRQVLIDLVVPGHVAADALAQREKLNGLYDPGMADAGRRALTMRSGDLQDQPREHIGEIDGRGATYPQGTSRKTRIFAVDNLWVLGGFDAQKRVSPLAEAVHGWLVDCGGSGLEHGHLLLIFDGDRVHVYDDQKAVDTLLLAKGATLEGPMGLYGPLKNVKGWLPFQSLANGGRSTLGFQGSRGVVMGDDGKQLGLQDILQYMDTTTAADSTLRKILAEHAGKPCLAYHLLPNPMCVALAALGGTGLLEPYPDSNSGARESVNERNTKVIAGYTRGFIFYTANYISRIDAAVASHQADPELLEKELYALGPPLSCPGFPPPAGASDSDYTKLLFRQKEVLSTHDAVDEYDAWEALTKALNKAWGVRSLGSSWIKCDFILDTQLATSGDDSLHMGPLQLESKVGISAKIGWNFEADTDGGFKQGSTKSASVYLGPAVFTHDGNKGSVSVAGKLAPQPTVGRPEAPSPSPHLDSPIHPLEEKQAAAERKDLWRREQHEARNKLDGKQRRAKDWQNFDIGPFAASWQPGVDPKTGRSYGNLTLTMGPFTFVFSHPSGAMTGKFSAVGLADVSVSFDPTTGRLGYGLALDLRKALKARAEKQRAATHDASGAYIGDPEKWKPGPSWIDHIPNIQMNCTGTTQLAPERGGAVLAMVLRSPGFFQMRTRSEFSGLQWNSLSADEQAALEHLDYDQLTWDTRALTAATRAEYFHLSAAQQIAAFALPVPNCDPYWVTFWHDVFAAQAKKAETEDSH